MFEPPARLNDFDRSPNAAALREAWHDDMLSRVTVNAASRPAFFNSLEPPAGTTPVPIAPEWTALPRTIKRLVPGPIAAAARLVDDPIAMGERDPILGGALDSFRRADGQPFAGPRYRPQDEYLEWIVRRDDDGVITEVVFTCEGPEYWEAIARDRDLLLALYQEIVGDTTIVLDDLLFPEDVTWDNPFAGGVQTFPAGSYNPYNRWNIAGAVHLTQPANTLGAEINLARNATLLFGRPNLVTSDPALVCCAGYGDVNRMSDPTIGSGVNSLVRAGRRVSLRNPIGLYMKGARENAITLPNDQPLPAGITLFEPLRPNGGGEMIVRARFRVPEGLQHEGRPVRLGELKVGGETIVTGGQLADIITMRLFAVHIAGAPQQQPRRCQSKPCPDRNRPEFIHALDLNMTCPANGFDPDEETPEAAGFETAPTPKKAADPYAATRLRIFRR